mmetsp:Transcript_163/g.374  ORF Transcript_163/g.374 Transcript_163/m.374 type:complete len:152 (+) Transcript_163:16-471(+)
MSSREIPAAGRSEGGAGGMRSRARTRARSRRTRRNLNPPPLAETCFVPFPMGALVFVFLAGGGQEWVFVAGYGRWEMIFALTINDPTPAQPLFIPGTNTGVLSDDYPEGEQGQKLMCCLGEWDCSLPEGQYYYCSLICLLASKGVLYCLRL